MLQRRTPQHGRAVAVLGALAASVGWATSGAASPAPPPTTISGGPAPVVNCDGASVLIGVTVTPTGTADGTMMDIWVLAGDSIGFDGYLYGCEQAFGPFPAAYGLVESEIVWSVKAPGGGFVDQGAGTVIDARRDVLPSHTTFGLSAITRAQDGTEVRLTGEAMAPNGIDGAAASSSATVRVLDPRLGLVKEVCRYSGAPDDTTRCVATDDTAWVEAQEVPAGADVFWRISLVNEGNVALQDAAVSIDELSGAAVGSAAGCVAPVVPSVLAVGERRTLVCVTSGVDASGGVALVNTATGHARFTDPTTTQRLIARYPDGFVDSNTDSAEVTSAAPAATTTTTTSTTMPTTVVTTAPATTTTAMPTSSAPIMPTTTTSATTTPAPSPVPTVPAVPPAGSPVPPALSVPLDPPGATVPGPVTSAPPVRLVGTGVARLPVALAWSVAAVAGGAMVLLTARRHQDGS